MRRIFISLAQGVGLRFAPDNHVVPVLRLEQFKRLEGPGFFGIIPLVERTLPPISTGIRVGSFTFSEILSRDNIPFTVQLTVLFTFDPRRSPAKVAAQLVRAPERVLLDIVRDYTSQALRRLASNVKAEDLGGQAEISGIERDLTRFLTAQLHILGLEPLKDGGVLIKETVAPDKFKRAMLDVRRHEATLRILAGYPELNLIDRTILAEFLSGLEDRAGNLTLLSSLYPLIPAPGETAPESPKQNGRYRDSIRQGS